MLLQAIRYAATYTDHISMPENAEALRWLAGALPALIEDAGRLTNLRKWADDASLGMTVEQVTRIRNAANSSTNHDATLAREQLIGLCDTVELLYVRLAAAKGLDPRGEHG
jgi:hypothetical protein